MKAWDLRTEKEKASETGHGASPQPRQQPRWTVATADPVQIPCRRTDRIRAAESACLSSPHPHGSPKQRRSGWQLNGQVSVFKIIMPQAHSEYTQDSGERLDHFLAIETKFMIASQWPFCSLYQNSAQTWPGKCILNKALLMCISGKVLGKAFHRGENRWDGITTLLFSSARDTWRWGSRLDVLIMRTSPGTPKTRKKWKWAWFLSSIATKLN